MAQLAKSLYDVVEKQMLSIINSDFGSPTSKLTILGGVQINMPSPYEDFFLPLFFKVKVNNESEWTDLLPGDSTPQPSLHLVATASTSYHI